MNTRRAKGAKASAIHSAGSCQRTAIRLTRSRSIWKRCSTASRSEAVGTPSYPSRLVLLGSDVGSSLSPGFHRAALAAAEITVSYDAVEVTDRDLSKSVDELRQWKIGGCVTRPHKVAFHDACDGLTPITARVGAVNTFWMSDGRLHGGNTDVGGFDTSVRE